MKMRVSVLLLCESLCSQGRRVNVRVTGELLKVLFGTRTGDIEWGWRAGERWNWPNERACLHLWNVGARAGILLIRQVNKEADSLFFVSTRHSLFCVFNKIVILHAIKEYQSKMFSGYGIRNNNSNKMRIEFIYLFFVDRTLRSK